MKTRVLLTGASGFIGKEIFKNIGSEYDVTAISSSDSTNGLTKLNLLDEESCSDFFRQQRPYDIVIHAAAIAHGKNHVNRLPVDEANILMTNNVFSNLDVRTSLVIFLSSVSVYSYKNNAEVIHVAQKPKPVSKYGESKLVCEEIIMASRPRVAKILRLTPVFTKDNLKDIRKRVFLPVLNKPFKTKQERSYSLASLENVTKDILNSFNDAVSQIRIVKDENDYTQDQLSAFFKTAENRITINQAPVKLFMKLIDFIPLSKFKIINDMLHKLFFSAKFVN